MGKSPLDKSNLVKRIDRLRVECISYSSEEIRNWLIRRLSPKRRAWWSMTEQQIDTEFETWNSSATRNIIFYYFFSGSGRLAYNEDLIWLPNIFKVKLHDHPVTHWRNASAICIASNKINLWYCRHYCSLCQCWMQVHKSLTPSGNIFDLIHQVDLF